MLTAWPHHTQATKETLICMTQDFPHWVEQKLLKAEQLLILRLLHPFYLRTRAQVGGHQVAAVRKPAGVSPQRAVHFLCLVSTEVLRAFSCPLCFLLQYQTHQGYVCATERSDS